MSKQHPPKLSQGQKSAEFSVHKPHSTEASDLRSGRVAQLNHQLRASLNNLMIFTELLSENPNQNLSAEQCNYLEYIRNSGHSLIKLVTEFVDLPELESGRLNLKPEQILLKDLIMLVESSIGPGAESDGLTFSVTIESGLPVTIFNDRHQIGQLLLNFLYDAYKFTEQGHIKFSVSQTLPDTPIALPWLSGENCFLVFSVEDTGNTHTDLSRNLSLDSARENAGFLGGEIQLTSDRGQGRTLTLYLPLNYKAPGPVKPYEPPVLVTDVLGTSRTNGVTASNIDTLEDDSYIIESGDRFVLIIEDDPLFAGLLRDRARRSGFKAIITLSGDVGFKMVRALEPSAILLDLDLPNVSGNAILEEIRSNQRLSHCKVCILSAHKMSQIESELKPFAYLQKPLSIQIIDQTLKELAQSLDQESSTNLRLEADSKELQKMIGILPPVNQSLVTDPAQMIVNQLAPKSEIDIPCPQVALPLAGHTVLVVDDEPLNRLGLAALLESRAITVLQARNGSDCLKRLEAHPEVDAVLMDVRMPAMDGLQATRSIRQISHWEKLPVIAITGNAMLDDRETCLNAGFTHYMTKPMNSKILFELLASCLDKK